MEVAGENVTWVVFCREYLRKYFPEDVLSKKEIEFLELKQGNMSIVEFYLHYVEADAKFSKCIMFENGLRPEIKKEVG